LLSQVPQATPMAGAAQLAFGYECDDRFLIRNESPQPVTVEYGVAGDTQRTPLTVKGNDAVELSNPSTNALELWANGKLLASERNGNRPCAAANAQATAYAPYAESPEVVVVPVPSPAYVVDPGLYFEPTLIYVHPAFGYGYGYGYRGYGYRGYGYRAPAVVVTAGSRGLITAGRPRVITGGGYRGVSVVGTRPGGVHYAAPVRAAVRAGGPARSSFVNGGARVASHQVSRSVGGGRAPSGGGSRAAHSGGGRAHH